MTLHSQTPPKRHSLSGAFEPFLGSDSWFDAGDIALGLALASPSTLNTLLQTLSCTAFAIASAAVNQQPEDPGPRVVGAKLIKRAAENVEVEKV